MYELVNTSLPNGLIPGTHGFAVVAMTKGLPDALRRRFETYCAYSHRTSAHDAAYFTENPVNWFHVTLPQGEHVMGRVAPADFDYTGRTNRLARLLVFSKNEMPAIGGASVLKKECARLSEAWSGEARWLEDDKLTVGRLRLENLQTNCDAPSWRAMFGNVEGLNLARGFARLLAKNLSTTGRTIYFKTATAYDVDGTRLLALFADLIDLLPVVDRRNVTFSTYPVALPQGTLCHLRGVYDRDRIFDASATTQPWVDCEKGIVHNASLLPPEEVRQAKVGLRQTTVKSSLPQGQSSGVKTIPSQMPHWIPPKKDGTKKVFIGIVISVLGLVAVAIGWGTWLYRETARKNGVKAETAAGESPIQKEAQIAPQRAEAAPKKKDAKNVAKEMTEKKDEQEAARKAAKEAMERRRQEERDQIKRETDLKKQEAIAKAQREKEVVRDREIAFIRAKKIEVLEDGSSIESKFLRKETIMTNGSLRAYWYDKNGVLTNALAGFMPPKGRTVAYAQWRLQQPPGIQDTSGNLIIWLDVQKNVAYWDWAPLKKRKAEEWFAKTNEIDLAELCFGSRPEVREAYDRKYGRPWRYQVEQTGPSQPQLLPITDDVLSIDFFVSQEISQKISTVSNELEKARQDFASKTNEYNTLLQSVQAYESKRSEFKKVENALNKKGETKLEFKNSSEDDLRKKKHQLETEIENILKSLGIKDKKVHEAKKFVDAKTSPVRDKVTKAEQRVNDLERKLSKLENGTVNDPASLRMVRQSKFRVVKVEGYLK